MNPLVFLAGLLRVVAGNVVTDRRAEGYRKTLTAHVRRGRVYIIFVGRALGFIVESTPTSLYGKPFVSKMR